MILTPQEITFINMINCLNHHCIRYWITFTSFDAENYNHIITPHCLYLTYFNRESGRKCRGFHIYKINISDDNINMELFSDMIRQTSFLNVFQDIFIQNNMIYSSNGYDYIQSTTYLPFYSHLQSNYVLSMWCHTYFNDFNHTIFERDLEKLINKIYHQDFARTFINIKNMSVKIITPRLQSEKPITHTYDIGKYRWKL